MCISSHEKPSDLPRNINHFQADLLKGFLNENLYGCIVDVAALVFAGIVTFL